MIGQHRAPRMGGAKRMFSINNNYLRTNAKIDFAFNSANFFEVTAHYKNDSLTNVKRFALRV